MPTPFNIFNNLPNLEVANDVQQFFGRICGRKIAEGRQMGDNYYFFSSKRRLASGPVAGSLEAYPWTSGGYDPPPASVRASEDVSIPTKRRGLISNICQRLTFSPCPCLNHLSQCRQPISTFAAMGHETIWTIFEAQSFHSRSFSHVDVFLAHMSPVNQFHLLCLKPVWHPFCTVHWRHPVVHTHRLYFSSEMWHPFYPAHWKDPEAHVHFLSLKRLGYMPYSA